MEIINVIHINDAQEAAMNTVLNKHFMRTSHNIFRGYISSVIHRYSNKIQLSLITYPGMLELALRNNVNK